MMRGLIRCGGAALAALLLSLSAAQSHAQTTRLQGVVNINQATAEQLELLPGIGPARSAAIISHRQEHGAFKRTEELVEVPGIGAMALARMKAHLSVKGKTTAKLVDEGSS